LRVRFASRLIPIGIVCEPFQKKQSQGFKTKACNHLISYDNEQTNFKSQPLAAMQFHSHSKELNRDASIHLHAPQVVT